MILTLVIQQQNTYTIQQQLKQRSNQRTGIIYKQRINKKNGLGVQSSNKNSNTNIQLTIKLNK